MERFERFLRNWVNKINSYNRGCIDVKKIILDVRLFDKNEQEDYELKEGSVGKLTSAKFCFIGDNPGNNERDNGEYFYYEIDEEKRDERCAGSKVKKLVDTLFDNDVIYFNKCLIHTSRTKELKVGDVKKTKEYVCDFINHLAENNHDICFVFFGVSSKFKCIYENLAEIVGKRSIITFHPCSSKYNIEDLSKKLNKGTVFKVKFENPALFCAERENDDGEDDGELPPPSIVAQV